MRILVIEDNPTDRKLMSVLLGTEGNVVMEHDSAEAALAVIKFQRTDLVLLDLKLPGMDGLALARQLKGDPETRHIPIVAVTAAAEKFPREEALRAGCDAYIVKPIDTRIFGEQVARMTSHPS